MWYPRLNIDVVQAETLTAVLFEVVENVPGFLDDRLASVEVLDDVRVAGDLFEEVARRHEPEAHALQEDGHVLDTRAVAVVDPAHERFECLVFGLDVQGVVADYLAEVVRVQHGQELVAASGHLDEVLQQVCYKYIISPCCYSVKHGHIFLGGFWVQRSPPIESIAVVISLQRLKNMNKFNRNPQSPKITNFFGGYMPLVPSTQYICIYGGVYMPLVPSMSVFWVGFIG